MQPPPKTRRKRKPKSKPGYDQALKEMLLASRDAFLALIAPGVTWVETLSEELPAGARRADLVWLVEDETGQRFILHIELQVKRETDRDKDIRERVAEYALRLIRRDHLPVYSIVIFLKPVTTPEPSVSWMWNGKGLQFSFEIIRLWEQQPEVVLETDHYGLWPLAVLMGQNVTAESTFAVAEKIAQAPVSRQEKSHLIGLLGVLVGMRLPTAELVKALERNHMIEEIWKESSFAEAVTEISRKEMARRMAQLALEGRFGTLSDDILAALKTTDEATLEAIVAHITSDTPEQVRARLGLS
jgi:hypothetical protein